MPSVAPHNPRQPMSGDPDPARDVTMMRPQGLAGGGLERWGPGPLARVHGGGHSGGSWKVGAGCLLLRSGTGGGW
jgi:hypothetical protein